MLIENDETNDDDIETKEVNEVNVNTAMKSLEKRLNYEGSLLLVSNHYDNQETYIRTCFHFFLQYCILNPSLVIVLTDIYAIAALQKQKEINNNIDNNNNAMEINETTTTITTTSTTITNTIPIKSKWDVIKSILESSLRDILPALIKRHKMDSNRIENEIYQL
jgi:D-arabinose 1-dehydrogenase-like Zn-dependent alcohol dehydrogenase